ncbi:MAG: ABC transporter ATP-binding protein [Chloroflexota bacterium]|nr:MAG: ABC transporter ATP-binding protein [Chloroflexota bacterium]
MDHILEIEDLSASYGKVKVLHGMTFTLDEGEVLSIIGSNGAGKTTLLQTISGLLRPAAGRIKFCGQDITAMHPAKIAQLGLVQVPEGRQVFSSLTVYDNLIMGAYRQRKQGSKQIKSDLDRVFDMFPRLRERTRQNAGTLSGGEQQMLAIGRAIMARPKAILLDEPSLGLAPIFVREIFRRIRDLSENGPVILVEQNVRAALDVSNRGLVMRLGKIVKGGDSRGLQQDAEVVEAFLGERTAPSAEDPRATAIEKGTGENGGRL